MSKEFKQVEIALDAQLTALKVWELPFQTIMSNLLFTVEMLDLNGRKDTVMDFMSRLSYIYQDIRNRARTANVTTTTESITSFNVIDYIEDINFLIGYAHFAMLMPQFHRGTFVVSASEGTNFKIDFRDKATADAEMIDRLYSYLSQQMLLEYKAPREFEEHLSEKAKNFNNEVNEVDVFWINNCYEYFQTYGINIKVIPDDILTDSIGVNYSQYQSFCSAVRAWCYYLNATGRAYRNLIKGRDDEEANLLASEHMEFAVFCVLARPILAFILNKSGLTIQQFKDIISWYLTKVSDGTEENIPEHAMPGDAYFPPFIWIDESVIFSTAGTSYMLTMNNVLYSLNKKKPRQFAENASSHLEPTLIRQIEYLFSFFPELKVKANVNYRLGEIDLVVLSEKENRAICFQIKATIAPDSARTVKRVEDRTLEGLQQIQRLESIAQEEKLAIVNAEFQTVLNDLQLLHVICLRSSAGSAEAWKHNSQYPVLNYVVLAYVLAGKIEREDYGIATLKDDILAAQTYFLEQSKVKIEEELLVVGPYEIRFPNVSSDNDFVLSAHIKIATHFPEYESAF